MAEDEHKYVVRTSPKSKQTTLILVIVVGLLGVHDFYVGRIGMGILKLFTCNFFGIGWIIDMVKVASGSYKDGAGEPIRK